MVYLDNAATSFPKPPEVVNAVCGVMEKIAGNPGRGGHQGALCGGRILEKCREVIGQLTGASDPSRVILTFGCTDSINMALKGFLHQGDEVLYSPFEHNAVMRPLWQLKERGEITLKCLPADSTGRINPEHAGNQVNGKTALCVLCHGGNVLGDIQPAAQIISKMHEYGVPVLLDAAQTAGTERLDKLKADMIALPGHKGLLGPMGTGALCLGEEISLRPFRYGGTGSQSESFMQPDMLPDRLESGTPNLPGFAGLIQGVRFALRHGAAIAEYEQFLLKRMREGLANIHGVTVYGAEHVPRCAVCAFNVKEMDSGEAAERLNAEGIYVRAGLHCAPSVHREIGTLERGAVRASIGPFNTEADVDRLLEAVQSISRLP